MISFLTSGTPWATFALSMIGICAAALGLTLAMFIGDVTARRHKRAAGSGAHSGCGTGLCQCMQAMASRREDAAGEFVEAEHECCKTKNERND